MIVRVQKSIKEFVNAAGLAVLLALTACDTGGDPAGDASAVQEILSHQGLADLYAQGDYPRVIEAVNVKVEQNKADDQDYLMSAKAHLALFDAVGAALQLEKVHEYGRYNDDYVLTQAKVLLLEGKSGRAEKTLENWQFKAETRAEAFLIRGDIAFFQKKFDQAQKLYDQAVQLGQSQGRYHLARAQLAIARGNLEAAKADTEQALELEGESSPAHYTLGVIRGLQGQFDAAEKSLLLAIQYQADNIAARLELVKLQILKNDMDEAQQLLDSIFVLSPQNTTARFYSTLISAAKGDDGAAANMLDSMSTLDIQNPNFKRLQGHVAYRSGEFLVAKQQLEYVLSVAPFDRASRIALADIDLRLGLPGQSLAVLQPLLTADAEKDLAAISLAAEAAGQLNDLPQAIDLTLEALDLVEGLDAVQQKDNALAQLDRSAVTPLRRQLATYLFEAGRQDEAILLLEALVDAEPTDATSSLLLANYLMRLGNYGAAQKVSGLLIATHEHAAEGYNLRAAIYHRQGNSSAALLEYGKALEINPAYVSARLNRGALLLASKDYVAAAGDLGMVLEEFPGDNQTQFLMARALMGAGEPVRALPYFERLERTFPRSFLVTYQHAQASAAVGDYEKAARLLDKALAIGSDGSVSDDRLKTLRGQYRAKRDAAAATNQR